MANRQLKKSQPGLARFIRPLLKNFGFEEPVCLLRLEDLAGETPYLSDFLGNAHKDILLTPTIKESPIKPNPRTCIRPGLKHGEPKFLGRSNFTWRLVEKL